MPFDKGLNKDTHPRLQPEGSWRHMNNGVINRQTGRIENEQGTLTVDVLPSGYYPIGSILLDDGGVVLFLVNSADDSRIVLFKDGNVTDLVADLSWPNDEMLAFPRNGRIEGTFRINAELDHIIYWTDNVNPPRFLNIDTLDPDPFAQIPLASLELFPNLSDSAAFVLDAVNVQGGALLTGNYQFAFSYVGADQTQTNFFLVTPPVFVNDDVDPVSTNSFDGADNDTPTSKSISFTLNNLDPNYNVLRIAVIKDQTTVSRLPDLVILHRS